MVLQVEGECRQHNHCGSWQTLEAATCCWWSRWLIAFTGCMLPSAGAFAAAAVGGMSCLVLVFKAGDGSVAACAFTQ
jgi:hypothetical protein